MIPTARFSKFSSWHSPCEPSCSDERVMKAKGKALSSSRRRLVCSCASPWSSTDMQEVDELVAEWQPTPLVEVPSELDTMTLTTVPTVHGPNGIKVRTSPNGKLVSS